MDAGSDETFQQQHHQQQQYEHSWKSSNHGNSLSDSRDYDTNSTRTSLTGSPPITLDFEGFEDKTLLASLLAPKLDADVGSGSGSSSSSGSIYSHAAGEQQVLQPLGISLTLEADNAVTTATTTTYTLLQETTDNNNIDIADDAIFTLSAPLLLTSTTTTNTTTSSTHIPTHTPTLTPTAPAIAMPIRSENAAALGAYNVDDICFTLEYQFQNQELVQVQPPTVVSFSMVPAIEDPSTATARASSDSNNNNNYNSTPNESSSTPTTISTAYFTVGTR